MSLQEIYQEITFQLEPVPTDPIKLSIILAHAINVHKGLKHNGLREEDAVTEWQGLAPGWDQGDEGTRFGMLT